MPVRVKKTRQIKQKDLDSDSIKTEVPGRRAANSAHFSATRHPVGLGVLPRSPRLDVPYVKDASGKRMVNPTQLAAAVAGAVLSACVLLTGPEPALARPVTTSSDAAAATGLPVAPPQPQRAAAPPRGRVYLFRGALGPIFSRGMDSLTAQLEHAGIKADVYEF